MWAFFALRGDDEADLLDIAEGMVYGKEYGMGDGGPCGCKCGYGNKRRDQIDTKINSTARCGIWAAMQKTRSGLVINGRNGKRRCSGEEKTSRWRKKTVKSAISDGGLEMRPPVGG